MHLAPAYEQIIRDYAVADRAFFRLLADVDDNPALKRAIMERQLAIAHELRGDAPPAPAPLWATLEAAVDVELVRVRPLVKAELALSRERKRIAVGCGPTQLHASYSTSARSKLRAIVTDSELSIREVAHTIGVAPRTLERHLAGDVIGRERTAWYHRLESIEYCRSTKRAVLSVFLCATKKRWGWNLTPQEKRTLIAGWRR